MKNSVLSNRKKKKLQTTAISKKHEIKTAVMLIRSLAAPPAKTFMLNIQLYLCSTMHIFFPPQMNLLFAFEMGGGVA